MEVAPEGAMAGVPEGAMEGALEGTMEGMPSGAMKGGPNTVVRKTAQATCHKTQAIGPECLVHLQVQQKEDYHEEHLCRGNLS